MSNPEKINRRQFIKSAAVVGAGLTLVPATGCTQTATPKSDDLNIAIIGAGDQGQEHANTILKMGKRARLNFKAVCDIWPYNRRKVVKRLKAYDHQPKEYEDFREMLDAEKDLDAVIIATPLFWHAEHTIASMRAGLHVYCEKEMANTIENAGKMVQASKETGKLLQIGRQRRSSSKYIHCADKLLKEAKILGRITAASGQWNRGKQLDAGWPKKYALDATTLGKYGYKSMHQLRNWKWYKGLGSGYIVELGSHQIDVFNWFLGATPTAILAAGGVDYYDKQTHQWPDNVMLIYEYKIGDRIVRASYQLLLSNSSEGYFTKFMGDEGTLVTSLTEGKTSVYREEWVPAENWKKWVDAGYLEQSGHGAHELDSDVSAVTGATASPTQYDLPSTTTASPKAQHLSNFFDAIRDKAKLNCPGEVAFKTAVTVLKINEAIKTGKKLTFKPEDFKV